MCRPVCLWHNGIAARCLGAAQGPQKPEGSRCSEMQTYLRPFFLVCRALWPEPNYFFSWRQSSIILIFFTDYQGSITFFKEFPGTIIFFNSIHHPPPPEIKWSMPNDQRNCMEDTLLSRCHTQFMRRKKDAAPHRWHRWSD